MQEPEQTRIFEQWLEAHKAILFKVASVYGSTDADREDLFQEIAIQLWHSVAAFRGDSAVTTWIYRVALNTAMSWQQKEKKHRDARDQLKQTGALLVARPNRDPRVAWLYRQISALDEVNRSLALLWLDGFSYQEMSKILGLSESNVGVKINRIKSVLADKLATENPDEL